MELGERDPQCGRGAAATGNPARWLPRLLRAVGWLLVGGGVIVLLYLAYLLWFTNLVNSRLQGDLLHDWSLRHEPVEEALPAEPVGEAPVVGEEPPRVAGEAYAAMWFERPGASHRPANDDVMYLVEGVTREALKRGPGHYPGTAAPGSTGNFAVAGTALPTAPTSTTWTSWGRATRFMSWTVTTASGSTASQRASCAA